MGFRVPALSVDSARVFGAAFLSLAVSLQSFYLPQLGLAVTPVLGAVAVMLAMLVLASTEPSPHSTTNAFLLLAVVLLAVLAAELLNTGRSDPKTTLGILFSGLSAAAVLFLFEARPSVWFRGIRIALVANVGFWYVQAVTYFTSGHYLDPMVWFADGSARYLSAKGLTLGGELVPRFTGFYNEPGTYSCYVFLLLAAWLLYARRFSPLVVAALASMFLSMSLFGIVLGALLVVALVFGSKGERHRFLYRVRWIFILVLAVSFWLVVGDSVSQRLEANYSGLDFRSRMAGALFDGSDVEVLLGHGTDFGTAPDWFAVHANGLGFWLVYAYGVPGLLVILFLLLPGILARNRYAGWILVLALLTKAKFSYPAFWFFWISVVFYTSHRAPASKGFGRGTLGQAQTGPQEVSPHRAGESRP